MTFYLVDIATKMLRVLNVMEGDNTGTTLSILFGITGVLISLLGLTSLFVSFNSQLVVQKLREIIYDIMQIPNSIQEEEHYRKETRKNYEQNLWFYNKLYKNQGKVIDFVLKLSVRCVWFVSFVWISYGFYIVVSIHHDWVNSLAISIVTFLGTALLIGFVPVLNKLNNIPFISNLPKPIELLDGNNSDFGFTNLMVLARTSSFLFKKIRSKEECEVYILTPFPIYNLSIKGQIAFPESSMDVIEKMYDPEPEIRYNAQNSQPSPEPFLDSILITSGGYQRKGNSSYQYRLGTVKFSKDTQPVITMELNNESGETVGLSLHVSFEKMLQDEKKMELQIAALKKKLEDKINAIKKPSHHIPEGMKPGMMTSVKSEIEKEIKYLEKRYETLEYELEPMFCPSADLKIATSLEELELPQKESFFSLLINILK